MCLNICFQKPREVVGMPVQGRYRRPLLIDVIPKLPSALDPSLSSRRDIRTRFELQRSLLALRVVLKFHMTPSHRLPIGNHRRRRRSDHQPSSLVRPAHAVFEGCYMEARVVRTRRPRSILTGVANARADSGSRGRNLPVSSFDHRYPACLCRRRACLGGRANALI